MAAWQDARTIALQLLGDIGPGKIILVPDFESDEDCRFFYSDRAIAFHRMILKAAGRAARTAGSKVVKHVITPKEYRAWLRDNSLADSPEERFRFLEVQTKTAS